MSREGRRRLPLSGAVGAAIGTARRSSGCWRSTIVSKTHPADGRACVRTDLRRQPLDPPTFPVPHIAYPIVQPALATLPKLYVLGLQSKSAPIGRQGHLVARITAVHLGYPFFQYPTALDDLTLM